jgi:hypothetical protein
MTTSASTTSGANSSSLLMAWSPSATLATVIPSSTNVSSTTFCIVAESSAIKSFSPEITIPSFAGGAQWGHSKPNTRGNSASRFLIFGKWRSTNPQISQITQKFRETKARNWQNSQTEQARFWLSDLLSG